jgi:hypothetical protein
MRERAIRTVFEIRGPSVQRMEAIVRLALQLDVAQMTFRGREVPSTRC